MYRKYFSGECTRLYCTNSIANKYVHPLVVVRVTLKDTLPTKAARYDSHPQPSISKTEERVEDF